MNIFISGGAKNGKSTLAQNLAVELAGGSPNLYYIATMVPTDEEDDERIRRHREDREGLGFTTIEKGREIAEIFEDSSPELYISPDGTFLLDSVTALLSNVMFPPSGELNEKAGEEVAEDLLSFIEKVKTRVKGNIIFVSDYIYSEAKLFDSWTECYRKALAHVDRCLAEKCEGVAEVSAGIATWHKGEEKLK